MSAPSGTAARPWYREPWPWLLMLPPLFSVAGGLVMLYLALSAPPEIVTAGSAPAEQRTEVREPREPNARGETRP